MHVTMLIHIGGTRDGVEWPPIGGSIELPDHEAADLIAVGYAKESDGTPDPAEPVEAAPELDDAAAIPDAAEDTPDDKKSSRKSTA